MLNNLSAKLSKLRANRHITAEEYSTLKDLLEKQVAKKVFKIHKAVNEEEMQFVSKKTLFGYCPYCGELNNAFWNADYCGDCGQELDWQNYSSDWSDN